MSNENVITADKLTKRFGSFTAVDHISFEVKKGEIFGFLGANGAGKTTAMRMLCGLSLPTDGKATVAGFDVYTQNEQIKKNIGYMSQKFSLYEDLTIRENIRFYAGIYGKSDRFIKEKTAQVLKDLHLVNEADKLVASLPLGWKQKLAFSVAIFHEPGIVFLDEPTGGVDPVTRREFWNMIYNAAAAGITIFVTTHYMDEAEYCHRVSIMVDGKIEALDSPGRLKEQFGAASMDDVFLQLAYVEPVGQQVLRFVDPFLDLFGNLSTFRKILERGGSYLRFGKSVSHIAEDFTNCVLGGELCGDLTYGSRLSRTNPLGAFLVMVVIDTVRLGDSVIRRQSPSDLPNSVVIRPLLEIGKGVCLGLKNIKYCCHRRSRCRCFEELSLP